MTDADTLVLGDQHPGQDGRLERLDGHRAFDAPPEIAQIVKGVTSHQPVRSQQTSGLQVRFRNGSVHLARRVLPIRQFVNVSGRLLLLVRPLRVAVGFYYAPPSTFYVVPGVT